MLRKNCTDFKQNHYNVFQRACVIIISRFFDITSLNGGLHEGLYEGKTRRSKNYPNSLKGYFSLEMPIDLCPFHQPALMTLGREYLFEDSLFVRKNN